MAYDEALAARVRDELGGEPGVTERKMFGGLGFMVDGHMAVAAGSTGDLMVRADPEHVAGVGRRRGGDARWRCAGAR